MIRLTHIDGSLPNLALMKLSHWHKSQGREVVLTRQLHRDLFEPEYESVYGSAIFRFSADRVTRFLAAFPGATVGGTGSDSIGTVEQIIGSEYEHYDYSGYPEFDASIGFTQRGCRLSCKFCVVPKKEGKPRSTNTIADIWRGGQSPKKLHLLDNDFFGQARDQWQARLAEIRSGGFKVCLSQGINARLIDDEAAAALSAIDYRDTTFKNKRLYTAWDNLRDEEIFFGGVDRLEKAGIPPKHLMAYMLIGYDPSETWERIWYRFYRMVKRGVEPYPMVFDRSRADLLCFQRWVLAGLFRFVEWPEYVRRTKSDESVAAWQIVSASLSTPSPDQPT